MSGGEGEGGRERESNVCIFRLRLHWKSTGLNFPLNCYCGTSVGHLRPLSNLKGALLGLNVAWISHCTCHLLSRCRLSVAAGIFRCLPGSPGATVHCVQPAPLCCHKRLPRCPRLRHLSVTRKPVQAAQLLLRWWGIHLHYRRDVAVP